MDLTDDEIKEICKKKPRSLCPEIHIIRQEIANTPEYIRRYFMELGRKENLQTSHNSRKNQSAKKILNTPYYKSKPKCKFAKKLRKQITAD